METTLAVRQSYLTFKLGSETFGARVDHVLEILEVPRITRIPRNPEYMRGVINLRGTVLPVIDTRIKFGLEPIADTVHTCIVVMNLQIDGQSIALGALVDAIQEVIDIDDEQLQAPPAFGSSYRSDLLDGMVKMNDDFILILNLNKVFSANDIVQLQEINSTSN